MVCNLQPHLCECARDLRMHKGSANAQGISGMRGAGSGLSCGLTVTGHPDMSGACPRDNLNHTCMHDLRKNFEDLAFGYPKDDPHF